MKVSELTRNLDVESFSIKGFRPQPLLDEDMDTLQVFLSGSTDEYDLVMKQFVYPIMDQIKHKKPYMRTRISKHDDHDLREEINPMTPGNNPDGEPRQPLADDDPGFYKTTELNPVTNRKNQKFVCKYCEVTYNKLYNMRDHIHMHKGLFPYSCDNCTKVFSQLANRNRHQKECHKKGLQSQKLFKCE